MDSIYDKFESISTQKLQVCMLIFKLCFILTTRNDIFGHFTISIYANATAEHITRERESERKREWEKEGERQTEATGFNAH